MKEREVWEALWVIHQYYFLETLERGYLPRGNPRFASEQVVDAMRLLDYRLDIAEEEGWIERVKTLIT